MQLLRKNRSADSHRESLSTNTKLQNSRAVTMRNLWLGVKGWWVEPVKRSADSQRSAAVD